MKYYIISKNGHRKGPFTFDELKALRISRDTLVWYNGLHGWTKAGEILELLDIVSDSEVPSETRLLKNLFSEMETPRLEESGSGIVLHKKQLAVKILYGLIVLSGIIAIIKLLDRLFLF